MSINLRSNSSTSPIYPLSNQSRINMAEAGAGTGAGAGAPVVICNENQLTGNFNPGKVAGQKIFLEKTKGLATAEKFPLSLICSTTTLFRSVVVEQRALMNEIHR